MGKINIFQGISNDYKVYDRSGKLSDILNEFLPKTENKHIICLKSGQKLDDDYTVLDDDIIFVRQIPGDPITIAVISVVTATISLGVSIYGAVKSYQQQKELQKQQRRSRAMSEKTQQSPFLKGAKNTSALGRNIPFIMGEVRFTPYTLTKGFYSVNSKNNIAGNIQFWNSIFINCYNDVLIENVKVGESKLVNPDTFIEVPKLDGTTEKIEYITPNKKANLHTGGEAYDENNIVEVRTNGEVEIEGLNKKVSSESYQDSLSFGKDDESKEIIKKLPENTYKAEICVALNGLRRYDDDDGWCSANVDFHLFWSNTTDQDETVWNGPIEFSTGYYNTPRTVRVTKTIEFEPSDCFEKRIALKIKRVTREDSNSRQDGASLCFINSYQYDAQTSSATQIKDCSPLENPWRDKTNRLGIKVIANDFTQGTLDEINLMVYAKARIWNGENWSNEKFPTRNPASWVLEILTTDIHNHSKFSDSEIDLESLGQLYEYCESENFCCDGVIQDDEKKSDVINNILRECNATMFLDAQGLWTFAIEKKQTVPVALLNEQTIKSVSVTKNFKRSVFAQKVTFTNRKTWEVDTAYFDKDGETKSVHIYDKQKVVTETAVKYITDYNHAYKYAHRLMAKQKLQPREVIVQVGHEGDYYPLYSMVLVQMKQLKVGLSSGTITNVITNSRGKVIGLETSDLCDFTDETKSYGMIIQAQNSQGKKHINVKVTGNGNTKLISFKSALSSDILPEFGNIYSFGYLESNGNFETITNKMMIMATKPNSEGWELTLYDYNDAVFDYGQIPAYKTNLTESGDKGYTVSELTYQERQRETDGIIFDRIKNVASTSNSSPITSTLTLSATATQNTIDIVAVSNGDTLIQSATSAVFEIKKGELAEWEVIESKGLNATYTFNRTTDGYPEKEELDTWRIRAKPINIYGKVSEQEGSEYTINTDKYGTWQLLPAEVTARVSDRTISLVFSQPTTTQIVYGNIRYKVQVKRFDDTQYYKPALNKEVYPSVNQEGEIVAGNEENYKDGNGYVISDGVFIQTMPLKGQGINSLGDTEYWFKITAFNEKQDAQSTELKSVALCTSIRDIVKANETSKEAYISALSAISANLGVIKQGGFGNGELNYWALSNVKDDLGKQRYEGEMRVGGNSQYLQVNAKKENGIPTGEYEIEFQVGNFAVSSTETKFVGAQSIFDGDQEGNLGDKLNRVFLHPQKIALQHRLSPTDDWYDVANVTPSGFNSKALISEKNLTITNQTIKQRRLAHLDIGKPYPSENSKVYHFDTDEEDQNGETQLTITDLEGAIPRRLVGKENNEGIHNYTPAILNYAPYSEVAKSLYGNFSIETSFVADIFTVDFWIQFQGAENQVLFKIGADDYNVSLHIQSKECFYNSQYIDDTAYNEETKTSESQLFYKYEQSDEPYFADNYNEKLEQECPYNTLAKESFNQWFKYYVLNDNTYILTNVDFYNYDDYVKNGLYKPSCVYNEVLPERSFIRIVEPYSLTPIDYYLSQCFRHTKNLDANQWYHFVITQENIDVHMGYDVIHTTDIKVWLNDECYTITKAFNPPRQAKQVNVLFNPTKTSFLIDELMIDNSLVLDSNSILTQTRERKPYAALCDTKNWNIYTVNDPSLFRTNIFESDVFKNAVRQIISDYLNEQNEEGE